MIWFWASLFWLDKAANVVFHLLRFGKWGAWETISARWGRTRKEDLVADVGCKVLDKIDEPGHCEKALENEKKKLD